MTRPKTNGARTRRPPKTPTMARLEKSALHHLGRFAATRTELRRVLTRRTMRAVKAGLIGREETESLIAAVIAKLTAAGFLDDGAVARSRATALRRVGRSQRAIGQKLAAKGIARAEAASAIAEADDGDEHAELRAAARLAERRRLGPYRTGRRDEATMKRDLAALARGGFSYAIARAVAGACTPETLAALMGDLD